MNKKDLNQWNVAIDKLMIWRGNTWIKYESKSEKLYLRVCFDQLIIASETKILESINMTHKIKGIFKDDVLILLINITGQEIRKLRFKIKSDSAICFKQLGKYFPVTSLNKIKAKNNLQMKYRDLEDILQNALDDNMESISPPLPSNYVDFIKLCFLDPAFPQTVRETEKILQEQLFLKK